MGKVAALAIPPVDPVSGRVSFGLLRTPRGPTGFGKGADRFFFAAIGALRPFLSLAGSCSKSP